MQNTDSTSLVSMSGTRPHVSAAAAAPSAAAAGMKPDVSERSTSPPARTSPAVFHQPAPPSVTSSVKSRHAHRHKSHSSSTLRRSSTDADAAKTLVKLSKPVVPGTASSDLSRGPPTLSLYGDSPRQQLPPRTCVERWLLALPDSQVQTRPVDLLSRKRLFCLLRILSCRRHCLLARMRRRRRNKPLVVPPSLVKLSDRIAVVIRR